MTISKQKCTGSALKASKVRNNCKMFTIEKSLLSPYFVPVANDRYHNGKAIKYTDKREEKKKEKEGKAAKKKKKKKKKTDQIAKRKFTMRMDFRAVTFQVRKQKCVILVKLVISAVRTVSINNVCEFPRVDIQPTHFLLETEITRQF